MDSSRVQQNEGRWSLLGLYVRTWHKMIVILERHILNFLVVEMSLAG